MTSSTEIPIEIANIVASGKLDLELDLETVAEDLQNLPHIDSVEHSYGNGNRLLIHLIGNETLGMLVSSGVYIFTGASSMEEVYSAEKIFLGSLSELNIISSEEPDETELEDPLNVQNIVFTASINGYQNIDLSALSVGLGLEHTEYEPEQFPGLVYRPDASNCTILVFSTGKIVLTGLTEEKIARRVASDLFDKIESLLG